MVLNDLKPEGYEKMVMTSPIMGGTSRYLRITAVDGGDFQIFILPDQ